MHLKNIYQKYSNAITLVAILVPSTWYQTNYKCTGKILSFFFTRKYMIEFERKMTTTNNKILDGYDFYLEGLFLLHFQEILIDVFTLDYWHHWYVICKDYWIRNNLLEWAIAVYIQYCRAYNITVINIFTVNKIRLTMTDQYSGHMEIFKLGVNKNGMCVEKYDKERHTQH